MSAEQKLIAIEEISEANAPAIYVAGGLKQFIDLVKAEVEGEVPDLTTRKGRERDVAHRRTINRAALDAFVAGGMTEECAKQAITLIAERKIPNITIQY